LFFDRFRDAVSRLPAGLVRLSPPATQAEVAAAEAALGRALPPTFVSFLRSFDGADLFHESVVIAGVGAGTLRRLVDLDREHGAPSPGAVVFAETPSGDRFVFRPDGAIVHCRGTAATSDEERWLAGSDFSKWLEAMVAHQRLLYGSDGEFSPDAFEPDSGEILPRVALRQAEKALRLDPGAAELHHERGVALRRLERDDDAREAFRQAALLDPENPWPWFELGRAALEAGVSGGRDALDAFEQAGRAETTAESSARFWIWAARAALLLGAPERLEECRRQALARAPDLAAALHQARDAAAEGDDRHALEEAEALVAALERPAGTARTRLAVLADGGTGPEAAPVVAAPEPSSPRTRTKSRRRP
jgi:tetratricopeptide (TPR) repeat protein